METTQGLAVVEAIQHSGVAGMSEEPLSARLEAYLEPYRGEFRRRDQARWAWVYLQGLLRAPGRKNIEGLARTVTLPADLQVEDVAQALQHFINQSPWDEGRLWQRRQEHLAKRPGHETSLFVLEEMAFVKQGRHSVGVQRQYSRVLGRKMNCQLAVVLHHVGPEGHEPLALRLYLPRSWLRDAARLDAAGVPEGNRQAAGKLELGMELLGAAREAGIRAAGVTAGPGWEIGEEMELAAGLRGLLCQPGMPPAHAAALQAGRRRLLEELGLDHFEGRSWRGFHHHACLVMLASSYLSETR
jgi:SRSO17 transposase